jgi:hypothetical protein
MVKSKKVKSKKVKLLRENSKSITRKKHKIMYGGVSANEFGIAVSIRNILKKYTLNHGDWKINSTNDYGDGFDLRNMTALGCINQIIHSNDINKDDDEEFMSMKAKFGEQGVSKPVTMEILNIILDDLNARFDALVIPERMTRYGVDKPKVLEQINSIKGEIGIFDNIDMIKRDRDKYKDGLSKEAEKLKKASDDNFKISFDAEKLNDDLKKCHDELYKIKNDPRYQSLFPENNNNNASSSSSNVDDEGFDMSDIEKAKNLSMEKPDAQESSAFAIGPQENIPNQKTVKKKKGNKKKSDLDMWEELKVGNESKFADLDSKFDAMGALQNPDDKEQPGVSESVEEEGEGVPTLVDAKEAQIQGLNAYMDRICEDLTPENLEIAKNNAIDALSNNLSADIIFECVRLAKKNSSRDGRVNPDLFFQEIIGKLWFYSSSFNKKYNACISDQNLNKTIKKGFLTTAIKFLTPNPLGGFIDSVNNILKYKTELEKTIDITKLQKTTDITKLQQLHANMNDDITSLNVRIEKSIDLKNKFIREIKYWDYLLTLLNVIYVDGYTISDNKPILPNTREMCRKIREINGSISDDDMQLLIPEYAIDLEHYISSFESSKDILGNALAICKTGLLGEEDIGNADFSSKTSLLEMVIRNIKLYVTEIVFGCAVDRNFYKLCLEIRFASKKDKEKLEQSLPNVEQGYLLKNTELVQIFEKIAWIVSKPTTSEIQENFPSENQNNQARGLKMISQLSSGEKSKLLASLISDKKKGGKRSLSKKRSRKTKKTKKK